MRLAQAAPRKKEVQIGDQLCRGEIPVLRIGGARSGNDFIQLEDAFALRQTKYPGRKLREFQAVAPGGCLVQQFSKAVNIPLDLAGALRRYEAFRADKAARIATARNQADIRQFGFSFNEDNVAR